VHHGAARFASARLARPADPSRPADLCSPTPAGTAAAPTFHRCRLDDTDVPSVADVDAFLGYLGVQGLQVVALGGLCGTGAAHVRQAVHSAAALRGQDGAVPLLEHVRQELLHEGQHRVEDQRHELLGVLWGQVGCGNEPGVWGGCIVKGVEVAGLSANLLGQPGRGTGVG